MGKGERRSNFQRSLFLLENSCLAEILSKLPESEELYLAGMQCELMMCLVYDS